MSEQTLVQITFYLMLGGPLAFLISMIIADYKKSREEKRAREERLKELKKEADAEIGKKNE